jgi:CHASE2 domain-containing sensor protein
MLFSFLGGLLAQLISTSGKLTINYVLAVIIAGFATFSLFKATGNHYSQLAAIFLFTPASLIGGLTYLRRMK